MVVALLSVEDQKSPGFHPKYLNLCSNMNEGLTGLVELSLSVAYKSKLPDFILRLLRQSMATVNCLVTNILQNIFFGVPQRKENTGLEQIESE